MKAYIHLCDLYSFANLTYLTPQCLVEPDPIAQVFSARFRYVFLGKWLTYSEGV